MYYQRAVQCYDQKYPTESLALELVFHLEEKPSQPPTNFLAPKPDDLYKLVKTLKPVISIIKVKLFSFPYPTLIVHTFGSSFTSLHYSQCSLFNNLLDN